MIPPKMFNKVIPTREPIGPSAIAVPDLAVHIGRAMAGLDVSLDIGLAGEEAGWSPVGVAAVDVDAVLTAD